MAIENTSHCFTFPHQYRVRDPEEAPLESFSKASPFYRFRMCDISRKRECGREREIAVASYRQNRRGRRRKRSSSSSLAIEMGARVHEILRLRGHDRCV